MILWLLSITIGVTEYLAKNRKNILFRMASTLSIVGIIILTIFILVLWNQLERPSFRTLGETRLWYSLFLSVIGTTVYMRWRFVSLLIYSNLMAILFLIINVAKPETYSKTLMPALQSIWFVPHVIVYIIAYAFLGFSTLIAIYALYKHYFKTLDHKILVLSDNFVYLGFAFLTFGLIFGAFWAKEAWGHYWTWDPKETWAFLTWIVYLLYMHYRYFNHTKVKNQLWILSLAFVILLMCWFGINSLPSAQNSVHVYSN